MGRKHRPKLPSTKRANGRKPTPRERRKHEKYCYKRARLGLEMENLMELVVDHLKANGRLDAYVHHPHNSPEDKAGKDFDVTGWRKDGCRATISFSMTISERKYLHHRERYPHLPQILVDPRSSFEEMCCMVLDLFER